MGIQVIGNGGVIVGAGEEARRPLHTNTYPISGNWYRYAGKTGTIGAALAADSELLQFRFLSGTKSFALVTKVVVNGIGIVAVGTALGQLGFYMTPARAWTVVGSGGTRIAVSGDNLQTETALANSQVNDIGIATTGALTAGTKTHDANGQGMVIASTGTGAVTTYQVLDTFRDSRLFDSDGEGAQPLVLANQEGFTIRTAFAGATALTYAASFTVIWAEVTAY